MPSPHLRHSRAPTADEQRRRWLRRGALGTALGSLAAALLLHPGSTSSPLLGPTQAGPPVSPPAATVGPLDPAGFMAGGCVAFGPTAGDRQRTVFLDAGHGDPDPGAAGVSAGRPLDEKDLTLWVALDTAEQLRARGYQVALSRTVDAVGVRLAPPDFSSGALTSAGRRAQLSARARCANLAAADVLVSIHFNSFSDPQVRGAETLYEPQRSFASSNRRLATLLQRNILRGWAGVGQPMLDRGVLDKSPGGDQQATEGGDDLVILGPAAPGHVDEPSAMPGALIEPLFITNPADANLAVSPAGRRALAGAITQGVDEFLQP